MREFKYKEKILVSFYIPPEDKADFLLALDAFMRGKVPNGEHLVHWTNDGHKTQEN